MKFLKVFCLIGTLLYSVDAFSQNEGNVPDSVELAVLKDLYISLGGDLWINNDGWPDITSWVDSASSSEMDTWFGIVISNYDIKRLELSENNLTGTIPETIGLLTSLEDLVMPGNLISDPLPDSLGFCINLKSINLSGNVIYGLIPDTWGQLINLTSLGASQNGIIDSLHVLAGMDKLEGIHLSFNKIEGDLSPISTLTKLKSIVLNSNNLTGQIPGELFLNNPDLSTLAVQNNYLTDSIPAEIGMAAKLYSLNAANNQLTYLPGTINNCTRLQHLELTRNKLKGELPSLSNLTNLQGLYLLYNQLEGNPFDAVKFCVNLEHLYLSTNNFSGEISPEVARLTKLKNLSLGFNSFTGTLSDSIGKLINLETFHVRKCSLSGVVPEIFTNMSKLRTVDLSLNKFEGNLPQSICGKPIISIVADGNKFEGSIPECYGEFAGLRSLAIHNNPYITGAVPENFKNMPLLTTVYGSSTGITSIPSFKQNPNKHNLGLYFGEAKLDPASIEINLDSAKSHSYMLFTYNHQNYGGETFYEVDLDGSISIKSIPGGINATYEWKKYDSVSSSYIDVTNLNESTNPEFFHINEPDSVDFGFYKATITNPWITQVFTSGPIEVIKYSGWTINAISSGNWNDSTIWSVSEGGESLYYIPRKFDKVIISGHKINIQEEVAIRELLMEQHSTHNTLLNINMGKLNISGTLSITGVQNGNRCDVVIHENGKIEMLQLKSFN